ncbi:MAG: EAL domain-containing protein, partial [Gammaproteobacteria bacterium]
KGSAKNLGANALSRTAKKLEFLGQQGATEAAAQLVPRLVSEFEAVKAALGHEIQPGVQETPESTIAQETPRVLVVDDDRGLRQTLRHVLRENGYRVEEAENGAKALAFCKRQLPDLILMDAVMPVMDGFTACNHIRELAGGSDIPILIITALDDDHAVEKAFSCGASDYIGKPVHFSVLRQRVGRLLDACYAEKRARQLAYRDGLTMLPNRNMFHDRLEAVLNGPRGDQHVHALLFLDLDRFKLVNDALGHEIGDLLLKAVGERIQGCVRGANSVARIGEDEFSVIVENISSAEIAGQVAEKIRKAVASPFSFLGQQVYVGGSIGIAIFPNNAQDDRTLIKQADMALSRAKALGRDRYCFYETGIGASVSKRLEMESELRRALERDEITLFYQPQVDLKSGRITGMEALVRWQHPERGVISPVEFIPLAEESGLIVPMGEWIMRQACKQAKAWIDTGISKPITVAVNVSARQFDQLEDCVARVLDETGLDPRFLELELTESSVMHDPKGMVTKLRCLKEIGVQISIDDFGTGYSSLSYLKHFPFDKLKIDRSFISNVTVDPDDAAIALTIISMAHSLKLKALAEGVETEGQLLYLARQGCDEIQGYYFCKPLSKDAATQLLERDKRLVFNKFNKPSRQTVLIVDDDPVVLALLSRLLEQDNRDVLSADSARAGLELLAIHDVQVVVSDQIMPEMDGIEFLSRVKELHPETVRIILTGHAEPETITKAVNKGWIYKFMSKPWDDEDLRAQVKEAFTHYYRSSKLKPFIRRAS